MLRRISLANKCLLLFGLAVVAIVAAALTVAWFRMNAMVDEAEFAQARQVGAVYEVMWREQVRAGAANPAAGSRIVVSGDAVEFVPAGAAGNGEGGGPGRAVSGFASEAFAAFSGDQRLGEVSDVSWAWSVREYQVARAVREAAADAGGGGAAARLLGVVVVSRPSTAAAQAMWVNTAFLASVGVLSLGLAVLVFYLITSKIILEPVRQLRETADEVREGNLQTRSDIATGDEFEDLAEAFNAMLAALQTNQEQVRAINASLDEKINQLAERNSMLAEAAQLKGEFLANVTHELRTPLNSILGFAELLEEQASREVESGEESGRLAKRRRYIDNILSAGRTLLDLIKGLLEMARVEAGKVEIKLRPVNVRSLCEQLVAMMTPQADKRGVQLILEVAENIPVIETDEGKLQQVVFNLLSNAVKFTGDMAEELRAVDQQKAAEAEMDGVEPPTPSSRPAVVTLRADALISRTLENGQTEDRVRISVLDTGPGIAPEDQKRIFEKFTQLDSGYGRKHAGTGLGLAICKELTTLLQGDLHVDSELGRGSMFSVILPLKVDPTRAAENKLELMFRSSLATTRAGG